VGFLKSHWSKLLKILIRNLSRDITEADLLELFQAHGRVQSCTIVMDALTAKSKGFGFVLMPVPHEAKAAVRALNGLELQGSKVRVKKAEPEGKVVKDAAEPATAEENNELSVPMPARTRIKKDGSPLGGKKPQNFRKKTS
jgi:RNA recognition motif-containing protein